ncbi:hypothetical protein NL30_04665 [Burkholderia contaminans]|nr:hypothetical protein NL30_04665 [Burkholderia contaminans]
MASTGSACNTLHRRNPDFKFNLSASAFAHFDPRNALNNPFAVAAIFMIGGPPTNTGRPAGIGSITELGIDGYVRSVCALLCWGGSIPIDQQLNASSAM